MSTPSPAPKILPGDHDTMTEPKKRSHYSLGCRHELCRKASSDAARARKVAKAAAAARTAGDPTPAAPTAAAEPSAEPVAPPTPAPKPAPPTKTSKTPARGASRRLQGLVYAGHSPVAIAHATQISVDNIWWLLFEQIPELEDVNHRIIAREFQRLRMTTPAPPAATAAARDTITARCRALAVEQGWVNPFGWDDIDHDDKPTHPNGQPQARPAESAAVAEVIPPVSVVAEAQPATSHDVSTPEAAAPVPAPVVPEPPQPAVNGPTALAAVRRLRELANAADALAEELTGMVR